MVNFRSLDVICTRAAYSYPTRAFELARTIGKLSYVRTEQRQRHRNGSRFAATAFMPYKLADRA